MRRPIPANGSHWSGLLRVPISRKWTAPAARRFSCCLARSGTNMGTMARVPGSGTRPDSGAGFNRPRGQLIGRSEATFPRSHDWKAMTTATRQRSETAEQILDLAETLIQTRGYSAFSYQDIADSLGIRKASIHYHFPSKTDLGIAVVDRYVARFGGALAAIAADQS